MAKTRRLSANRLLVELIENGIEAERHKQHEFFSLAERFREATDPKEIKPSTIKWGAWFSAADAEDGQLGQVSRECPPTPDRPHAGLRD